MAQHKPKHGKTFVDQVVKCARVFVQQLGFHMGPPSLSVLQQRHLVPW